MFVTKQGYFLNMGELQALNHKAEGGFSLAFPVPVNNVSLVLAAPYSRGSGAMQLELGGGAVVLAALAEMGYNGISASNPVRWAVRIPNTTDRASQTIYESTGLSGDIITGLTPVEGTIDQDFPVDSLVGQVATAGFMQDIIDFINGIPVIGPLGGDLSGTLPDPILVKVGGIPVGTMATQNADAVDITGGTITGLPTPVAGSDAANKDYVDTASGSGKSTWVLGAGVPVAVGANKTAKAIMDQDRTLTKVYTYADIAPVGADLILDILFSTDNGTTFTSLWVINPVNRPTIVDGSNFDTVTAFDILTLSAGDLLRVDVIQVGSTTPGQDITLQLQYR